MSIKEKNIMKRCFEQRDYLMLLLAAPARIIPNDRSDEYQNNPIQRLAAHINDGNVSRFPVYELKSILSALADECRGDRSFSDISLDSERSSASNDDQPPRKRTRRSRINNNLHSILKFVERIIDQRYNKRGQCKTEDKKLLDDKLKSYFGTKDILFQADEEILCLAFEMALDAIVQSDDDEGIGVPSTCQRNSNDNHHNLKVPAGRSNHVSILCGGIIRTALKIIHKVALIDGRERATRGRLQQAKKNSKLSSNANDVVTDRRKKYEHLLQLKSRKPRDNGEGIQQIHSETSSEVKTIMEEKYSKQWEWLRQFRTKYETKESTSENTIELQQLHYAKTSPEKINEDSTTNESCGGEKETAPENDLFIIRRRIETFDDISLSSNDSEEEMNIELSTSDAKEQDHNLSGKDHSGKSDIEDAPISTTSSQPISVTNVASAVSTAPASPLAKPISPYDKLDQETYELRIALLDMPPSESSSTEVVRHTVDEIGNLLRRYGEVDGAAGISRCGDVFGGNRAIDTSNTQSEANTERFPLNDAMVSSLVKSFLTDATGALRAKAFLRAFVLPLMIEMNPTATPVTMGYKIEEQKVAKKQGKPASRVLTSLLASLSRDRPTECVVSVVVPSLVLTKHDIPPIPSASETSLFEPTRFQCELISRVLRGKDALSIAAITLLVEEVLPTKEEANSDAPHRGGMRWTENTMPVMTACMNRQPSLPDGVVAKLADEISYQLSPKKSAAVVKSMKFSTLFHALVTKYGSQVKSTGRVESLKDAVTRLKTFMSKTIGISLKKLS